MAGKKAFTVHNNTYEQKENSVFKHLEVLMSDPNFPETAQDTLQTCGSEQHVVAWILAVALQL